MKSTDALLIKIENTKEFHFVIVSDDRSAVVRLFPRSDERLRKFENITAVQTVADLLTIYVSNKNKRLVVFIDVTSHDRAPELKEIIYSIHAEARGLLFAFTSGALAKDDFERLILAGFDDVFELESDDVRQYVRMYSWIRRFGGTPILAEHAERNAIAYLGTKKNKRIGKWTVIGSEMAAYDDSGLKVKLTRQEIDFLTFLFEEATLDSGVSYDGLFKSPHAIVHKLKKKLGGNLPVQHDVGGRYHLSKSDRAK
jgi:hypothetical protein